MGEPSTWAMEQARRIYLFGECKCDHNGACDLHTDIARELDAAREEGRRERDADVERAREIIAESAREAGFHAGVEAMRALILAAVADRHHVPTRTVDVDSIARFVQGAHPGSVKSGVVK